MNLFTVKLVLHMEPRAEICKYVYDSISLASKEEEDLWTVQDSHHHLQVFRLLIWSKRVDPVRDYKVYGHKEQLFWHKVHLSRLTTIPDSSQTCPTELGSEKPHLGRFAEVVKVKRLQKCWRLSLLFM